MAETTYNIEVFIDNKWHYITQSYQIETAKQIAGRQRRIDSKVRVRKVVKTVVWTDEKAK